MGERKHGLSFLSLRSFIHDLRRPSELTAEKQALQQRQAELLTFLEHPGTRVTTLLKPPEENDGRRVVIRIDPLHPRIPPEYLNAAVKDVQTLKTEGLDPEVGARVQTIQKQLADALASKQTLPTSAKGVGR